MSILLGKQHCSFKQKDIKQTYDHVELSFTLEHEPVDGVLNGDYRHWTFTSAIRYFLHFVPDGVLKSSAGWQGPIPKEIHMLYKFIWTAAEAKGFVFNGE